MTKAATARYSRFAEKRNDAIATDGRRNELEIDEFTIVAKAIIDPTRLRMLNALRGGELCGCHLMLLLSLAPSTISKHLSVLERANLVTSRRDGKWVHYRLVLHEQNGVAENLIGDALRALADSTVITSDDERMIQLRQKSLVEVCAKPVAVRSPSPEQRSGHRG